MSTEGQLPTQSHEEGTSDPTRVNLNETLRSMQQSIEGLARQFHSVAIDVEEFKRGKRYHDMSAHNPYQFHEGGFQGRPQTKGGSRGGQGGRGYYRPHEEVPRHEAWCEFDLILFDDFGEDPNFGQATTKFDLLQTDQTVGNRKLLLCLLHVSPQPPLPLDTSLVACGGRYRRNRRHGAIAAYLALITSNIKYSSVGMANRSQYEGVLHSPSDARAITPWDEEASEGANEGADAGGRADDKWYGSCRNGVMVAESVEATNRGVDVPAGEEAPARERDVHGGIEARVVDVSTGVVDVSTKVEVAAPTVVVSTGVVDVSTEVEAAAPIVDVSTRVEVAAE
ncbi:hypothetical protein M9H77_23438 [Catharanthus roseus]|uniref:Uncharacterized protein n=1 Tax=Catharanthus roseus TaxID=4058 RepID=A0ACC0AV12_CATRO|nr:hypothetical protein M9H77_23438 [Catharanthus roseus]